jgi:hypothetical protein
VAFFLAGDPSMLASHPHGHPALLLLGGLIEHPHRLRVGQVGEDEPLHRGRVSAHRVAVVLHAYPAHGREPAVGR